MRSAARLKEIAGRRQNNFALATGIVRAPATGHADCLHHCVAGLPGRPATHPLRPY